MNRNPLYLEHILASINLIIDYTSEGKLSLQNDTKTYDAVLRQLQIMSESTKRLSDDLKARHSKIQWREIIGFRNILVHEYLGHIDPDIIWKVVTEKLPELKIVIETELSKI